MEFLLPQPSYGRQVLRMSLTWLFLGAVVGVVRGLAHGSGVEIVSMMIGGMIVLPIPGLFLGLIGGDAKGSVAGAFGGLLGCWFAQLGGLPAIPPTGMSVIVILGALVGATGFQFARFLAWKYVTIFKLIAWLLGLTPTAGKASALAGHHFLIARRLASYPVYYQAPATSQK